MIVQAKRDKTLTIRPIEGQWSSDPAQDAPINTSPDMLNFQVYKGYIRKRPGYGRYQTGSTFPPNTVTGIFSAVDSTSTRRLFAVTKLGLYRYNVGTTNWDAMTGPALTAGDTDLVSFEISQNNLIFSNGVDNIMAMPLATAVYAVINANAKPAKYIRRFNNRLYAAFTQEAGSADPFRLRWPVSGDHTNWIGLGAGFLDLTDPVVSIKGILKIQEVLAVYSDNGIWVATKTAQSTAPAQFDRVVGDIIVACPKSLQGYNILHFFVGGDNFYAFNGVQVVPLFSAVRDVVYAEINPQVLNSGFATLLYDTQEYVAFLATGSNTSPDSAWVYNWARQIAYKWKFALSEFTCSTLHYLDSSTTIAQLVGAISTQGWQIGSFVLTSTFPVVVLGDNDGHVHVLGSQYLADDGNAIMCRWTSKSFTARDVSEEWAGHMVSLSAVGFSYYDNSQFTLQFYYSQDDGPWDGPYPVTVGGVGGSIQRDAMSTKMVTGKRVKFKIENNTTGEAPNVIAFYPMLRAEDQLIA